MNSLRSITGSVCLTALSVAIVTLNCLQGTEVGNPSTVIGKVATSDNNPVEGARISLLSPGYSSIRDTLFAPQGDPDSGVLYGEMVVFNQGERISVTSDQKGEFKIDNIPSSNFNLFISDSSGSRFAFRKNIHVDQETSDLGTIQVTVPGYATIIIQDTMFHADRFLLLSSVPLQIPVTGAGQYSVPIVGDTLDLLYVNSSRDSLMPIVQNKSVAWVPPGDTLDLTDIPHVLVPPSLAVMVADTLRYSNVQIFCMNDTIILISALNAFSNKGHVLQYQFFEASQNFISRWDTSLTLALPVASPSNLLVSCRVRSRSDTAVVTSWTPGLKIQVSRDYAPSSFPRPYPPTALDTFPYGFLRPYRFIIHPRAGTDTIPAQYRLGWRGSSFITGIPWSNDTIQSIVFPSSGHYRIFAQARSGLDSTVVSAWSDSLYFIINP